jgi:hypothetical protein
MVKEYFTNEQLSLALLSGKYIIPKSYVGKLIHNIKFFEQVKNRKKVFRLIGGGRKSDIKEIEGKLINFIQRT